MQIREAERGAVEKRERARNRWRKIKHQVSAVLTRRESGLMYALLAELNSVDLGRATALLALVNPEAVLVTLIRGSTAVRDKALLVENRSPARAEQPARPTRLVRVPDAVVLVPVARVGVVAGGRVLVEDAVVLVPLLLVELRGAGHDDGVAVDVEPKHGRRRGGGPLEDGAARHVGLLGRGLADEGDGRRGEQERAGELHACAWANF